MLAAVRPTSIFLRTSWGAMLIAAVCSFGIGPAAALEFSRPVFEDVAFTVCKVDLGTDRLELFLTAPDQRPFADFWRLESVLKSRGSRLVFAMNAGMFKPDFSPVGLFVAGGNLNTPLNLAEGKGNFFLKPNGVFAVVSGEAGIWRSEVFAGVQTAGVVSLAT